MLIDLLGDGRLQVSDSKICSKYIAKGLIEGFVSKEEIEKVISENDLKIDSKILSEKSEPVVVWDLHREDAKSNLHIYIDIDNTIIEAKVTMTPRYSEMKILEESFNRLGPISRLKMQKHAQDVFESSNYYVNELRRLDNTDEGKLRTAISEEIGDIAILVEKVDFVNGKTMIPIGISDKDWKSPIVVAEAIVDGNNIDITDVENKVAHLLRNEDALARIGHKIKAKIRNRSDLNYRKNHNNGNSLNKGAIKGKTNIQSKVSPNRGRNPDQQDQKKREGSEDDEPRQL